MADTPNWKPVNKSEVDPSPFAGYDVPSIFTLLTSKAIWTGIAQIAAGAYLIYQGNKEAGITLIMTGLSTMFIRDAVRKGTLTKSQEK